MNPSAAIRHPDDTTGAVALFPPSSGEQGEYLTLLEAALTRAGVVVRPVGHLSWGWAGAVSQPGVVHLHWLEFLAPGQRGGSVALARSAWRATRLLCVLARLRSRGIAVVWTVHNLRPHEPAHPRLERWLARSVLGLADAAIVHSEHARARVAAELGGAGKLIVIPHGNYCGVYPDPVESRAHVRRRYGLSDDAYVLLAFGQIRPYKRLTALTAALAEVDDEDVILLIAGEPKDASLADALTGAAAADPRIRLALRRVGAEEVMGLHAAADAAVLSYGTVFSSGAALLALSAALPVVAPADSTVTEIAPWPASEAVRDDDLAGALRRVSTGDRRAQREAALRAAARYGWDGVGSATAAVYARAGRQASERRQRSRWRRLGAWVPGRAQP